MKKWYVYELVNLMGYVECVGETIQPEVRMKGHTRIKPSPKTRNGKFYEREDLVMNIVAEFDNRPDALKLEGQLKKVHGLEHTEITKCVRGGTKTGDIHKESGHIYELGKYMHESGLLEKAREKGIEKCSKIALVYKVDGTFVGEYKSLTDAANSNNLCVSKVSAVARGKRTHTKGYIIKKK